VISDAKKDAWRASYGRRENYVFSPSDEVVRFVARYLRRRIDLDDVVDVLPGACGSNVLDVGCGIGRNLVFGSDMGLRMWGFDLSEQAVAVARKWLARSAGPAAAERIVAADIRALPWPDGFFDHALSDSVLDSMSYDIAVAGIAQVARVLKPGGYFYCNLISSQGAPKNVDFAPELLVTTTHEHGTIQSHFNEAKARALLGPAFEILSCALHTDTDAASRVTEGRWHIVCKRSR
jgi:ubiquinone/menaquinone biosynthesis C-methylase UbiE